MRKVVTGKGLFSFFTLVVSLFNISPITGLFFFRHPMRRPLVSFDCRTENTLYNMHRISGCFSSDSSSLPKLCVRWCSSRECLFVYLLIYVCVFVCFFFVCFSLYFIEFMCRVDPSEGNPWSQKKKNNNSIRSSNSQDSPCLSIGGKIIRFSFEGWGERESKRARKGRVGEMAE